MPLEDGEALRRLDGAQRLGCLVTSDGILRAVFEQAGEKLDGAQHLHLPEGIGDLVPQQHRPSAVEEVHERRHSAVICPVAQHKDLLVLFAAALVGLLGAGTRHGWGTVRKLRSSAVLARVKNQQPTHSRSIRIS